MTGRMRRVLGRLGWGREESRAVMDPAEVVRLELERTYGPAFPHCDTLILHSPGSCIYCDKHPDRQAGRVRAGVAFSDYTLEMVDEMGLQPCPSTIHRPAEVRDRWYGNTPRGYDQDLGDGCRAEHSPGANPECWMAPQNWLRDQDGGAA